MEIKILDKSTLESTVKWRIQTADYEVFDRFNCSLCSLYRKYYVVCT